PQAACPWSLSDSSQRHPQILRHTTTEHQNIALQEDPISQLPPQAVSSFPYRLRRLLRLCRVSCCVSPLVLSYRVAKPQEPTTDHWCHRFQAIQGAKRQSSHSPSNRTDATRV